MTEHEREWTPKDLLKEIDPSGKLLAGAESLTTIIHGSDNRAITQQCMELGMALAVRAYQVKVAQVATLESGNFPPRFYGVNIRGNRLGYLYGITD